MQYDSYRKVVTNIGGEWTVVRAPISCNFFVIRNTGEGNILIRTSEGEGEDVLAPDTQDGVTAACRMEWPQRPRFFAGDPVFWLRAEDVEATQRVVITWVA